MKNHGWIIQKHGLINKDMYKLVFLPFKAILEDQKSKKIAIFLNTICQYLPFIILDLCKHRAWPMSREGEGHPIAGGLENWRVERRKERLAGN